MKALRAIFAVLVPLAALALAPGRAGAFGARAGSVVSGGGGSSGSGDVTGVTVTSPLTGGGSSGELTVGITNISTGSLNWSTPPTAAGNVVTVGANGAFAAAAQALDGWTADSNTWTYLSSTTFTISADMTTKIAPGDKLKFTNNSATHSRYVQAIAFGVALTTVTTMSTSDSATAAGVFTSPYYSHEANPVGFTPWMVYVSSYTGFGGVLPAPSSLRYRADQGTIEWEIYYTSTGTSTATSFTMTLPVPSKNLTAGLNGIGPWTGGSSFCVNNGVTVSAGTCNWNIVNNSSTLTFILGTNAAGWANVNGKGFAGNGRYGWR